MTIPAYLLGWRLWLILGIGIGLPHAGLVLVGCILLLHGGGR